MKSDRLDDAVQDAHRVGPRTERVDREIEQTHGDVRDAREQDQPMAAIQVHRAPERRPHRDRSDRRHRRHHADLHLARTELVQVPGQVQIQVERERLQEVRGGAEQEGSRQQPFGGHRGSLVRGSLR